MEWIDIVKMHDVSKRHQFFQVDIYAPLASSLADRTLVRGERGVLSDLEHLLEPLLCSLFVVLQDVVLLNLVGSFFDDVARVAIIVQHGEADVVDCDAYRVVQQRFGPLVLEVLEVSQFGEISVLAHRVVTSILSGCFSPFKILLLLKWQDIEFEIFLKDRIRECSSKVSW